LTLIIDPRDVGRGVDVTEIDHRCEEAENTLELGRRNVASALPPLVG